jgi:hypothetical protein
LQPQLLKELGANGLYLAENKHSEEMFIKKINELCEVLK